MMMSPESFVGQYEESTYDELLEIREQLLEEIYYYEKGTDEGEEMILPSPETRYLLNLEYLGKLCELIIQKYREKYVPLDEE